MFVPKLALTSYRRLQALKPQRLDLLMELSDLYEVLAPTQSNHHLMISIENL